MDPYKRCRSSQFGCSLGWLGQVSRPKRRRHGKKKSFPLPFYRDPFTLARYGKKLEDGTKAATAAVQKVILDSFTVNTAAPSYLLFHPSFGSALITQFAEGVTGNLSLASTGQGLSSGQTDPNWSIIESPAGGVFPRAATVQHEFGAANDANSSWIKDGAETLVGDYVVQTTFDLTGFDHTSASISFGYLVEKRVVEVLLNDNVTGVSSIGALLFSYQNETLNNPAWFVEGVNTLKFKWNKDTVGSNGLRVKVTNISAIPLSVSKKFDADHISTDALRNDITGIRYVSSGMRITARDNPVDGTWEAIRVPITDNFFQTWSATPFEAVVGTGANQNWATTTVVGGADWTGETSYQTGNMSDLVTLQFKFNSTTPTHAYQATLPNAHIPDVSGDQLTDLGFDMIFIRLNGNPDVANPTIVDFEIRANFEIEFAPGSAKASLMTTNPSAQEHFTADLAAGNSTVPATLISDLYQIL